MNGLHSGAAISSTNYPALNSDPVEVQVFPNPAVHYFELQTKEDISVIEVYTLLGRKMLTLNYELSKQYDISALHNGMYLIQLLDDSGKVMTTRRLQKR